MKNISQLIGREQSVGAGWQLSREGRDLYAAVDGLQENADCRWVTQTVLAVGVFDWRPVTDVGHAVLLEELGRVVAEPGVECVELAVGGVVDAHLEEARLLVGGEHRRGRDHKSNCKQASFHATPP